MSVPLETEPQASHSESSSRIRWMPVMAVAAVAIAGYLVWARSHSVDRALVGHWTKGAPGRTGALQSTFVIGNEGRYELETLVRDNGRLVASNGQFRMISSTRTSVAGSYRVLDPKSLEVTSVLGEVVWKRRTPAPTGPLAAPMTGRWEAAPIISGVVWHQTIDVEPDSTYTLSSVSADSGCLTTSAAAWRMVTTSGHESEGTYQLKDSSELVLTAAGGRSIWRRPPARP